MDITILNIAAVLLLTINFISFLVMFWDKKKARRGERRISEKTLFLLALFFGGIGIFWGMLFFRHKTQKWYFAIGIPLVIVLNVYLSIRLLVFYLAY